ncbi:FolM Alternative dihydrofolate reductase 1 [Caenispirillum salinarum AK4]|uniref:FolM Alternative dihydrofolate reductase 1 n=1 Tax=Caenispirillum salinarum AK4 TaxID=1238182 RepID=K9H453_9PROT|nr:SDR family oxidoreductase [Caenispirillum salinarum]EKV32352.1 FolM Alternative dihydrofolate reductase 1 [Caenispirillum salinarum AK4]
MTNTPRKPSPSPRTVLITGSAKRIGRAIALDLADHGWDVAVHYRSDPEEADAVCAEIEARGRRAVALRADLGREADVAGLVEQAAAALGPLGALVNNASVFEYDDWNGATRESWDLHMEANLRAPFVLTQAFARQVEAPNHGCVVNIIDERVWNLTPHFVTYTLSKAGLWTLTQTLALALAPRIRVNAIGPGPTLPSPRQSQEQFDAQSASMPLERGTTPEEVCDAVRFILAAPAMTGQMIALDGGQHLAWSQDPHNGKGPQSIAE